MIVVVIIISLLGLIVVPRLLGVAGRQSEVEAEAVRSLLSAAAQRDAAGSRPLAIGYTASRRELRLFDLADKDGVASWQPAPLVRPVGLSLVELRDAIAGGQSQAAGADWRIELPQARARPVITLVVRTLADGVGEARAWQVDLLPGAVAAQSRSVGWDEVARAAESKSVDLDATGRRSEPW